jgi:hypothetical protein
MIIAVFLPRVESATFPLGIAENTLIQSGQGWLFLGVAAGIAGATYRNWQSGFPGWTVTVLGAVAAAYAVYVGTDSDSLTLYSLNEQGDPNSSGGGTEASPAIGIYMAGVGGLLAVFGGWQQKTETVTLRPASEGDAASEDSGPTSAIDDLERLQKLRDDGVLTEEQFEGQKTHVLDRRS